MGKQILVTVNHIDSSDQCVLAATMPQNFAWSDIQIQKDLVTIEGNGWFTIYGITKYGSDNRPCERS